MARKAGLTVAWMLATIVSIFIAAQAVGGVGEQVTDRPSALPDIAATIALPPVSVTASTIATPAAATTVSEAPTISGAPTTPPTSAPTPPPTTPASSGESTTTTAVAAGSATTTSSSTTTSTTSTTTTTLAAFDQSQYQLIGGVVALKSRPGEVFLVGASPNPGYEVEVENTGPSSVEVEFEATAESDPYEGKLHAEWRDGKLEVDIEEHAADD